MARLADQCQMWQWQCDQGAAGHAKALIASCEVIVADNVADYFLGASDDLIPEFNWLKEVPCAAPPFPRFFIEFKMPRRCEEIASYGFAFKAWPGGEFDQEGLANLIADAGLSFSITDIRWVYTAFFIAASRRKGYIYAPKVPAWFLVGESGALLANPAVVNNDDSMYLAPLYAVPMLTIAFMHCKNIMVEENAPTDEEKRRHAKGGNKKPLCKYRTLHIEPMKQVLRTEGGIEANGIKKALHICRGHFADYTEKGLFGKYFGRYWVPQHVRGSAKQGVVVKDYSLGVAS